MTTRVPTSALAAFAALVVAGPAGSASPPADASSTASAKAAAAPAAAPQNVALRRDVEIEATYLYNLSTNFGPLPFSDVRLNYDPQHRELYVTGDGPVRVFNDSGMEIYTFGDDPELGYVYNIASLENGDLIALSQHAGKQSLVRCTFRGEFLDVVQPRGVPESYAKFSATMMRYANGKIYLADTGEMLILVLDASGSYVASYDVADKLGEGANRGDLGLRGFNVDREGNMLFTIQPLFKAYTMSPDGTIRGFGQKGSAPGKFNVVGGIARDDAGNYYVADMLKSAVLVFDRELTFRKEFGYRGRHVGSLVAPEEVVAAGNRLFVSQRARRGVSVFQVVEK